MALGMQCEFWNPIPSWEQLYSVSTLGNVRIEIRRQNIRAGQSLRQNYDRDGYLMVRLSRPQGPGKTYRVHRLVAEAFIGELPSGMQVNHKNGIRDDNRVENLEIVSCAENVRHAVSVLGRDYKGAANPATSLTESDVVDIRERAADGETFEALAADYQVTSVTIANIARGLTWASAGGPRVERRNRRSVRLTQEQVAEIRDRHEAGEGVSALAKAYGVSRRTIYNHLC